ncbi:MAG TPA: transglutaminase domain-containing protein, partial [Planctomycetota bacterium]|nr:transglutaminase domain-containing protein [Planctomycetota bacterium]
DPFEFAPSVSVTTYGSWDEFTSWWWNLIQKEMETSPAMRDKIASLTRDKKTEMEKIRAIYEFVVTDVRYNAWEFGVHGYQPYNASTVFDRGHGDCKDKALLMNTMLREIGVRAYPVLIHADDERPIEDLSVPLIGLFNHCISYLPATADRPAMFLDGTARDHSTHVLPDMDRGASVVVVEDGKPRFENVGYPEPEDNLEASDLTVDLKADGSAKGSLVMKMRGRYDVLVRELFGSEQGAQKENLERILTPQLGRTRVVELQTSDLHDLSAPVELRATLEIERIARARGQDFALPVCLQPRKLLQSASEAQRTYDLVLGVPESDEFTTTYRLPEGMGAASVPGVDARETPFGAYEVRSEANGRTVVVRSKSRVTMPRVTPAQYGEFRQFARELDEAQAREIVVRNEP